MDRSDVKMTTLLTTTGEFHRSMTLRAEETDRRINQLAEKYEGLERRGNLLLGEQNQAGNLRCLTLSVAAPASGGVTMDPVHTAGNRKGKNRQDENQADAETDLEDEVEKKIELCLELELMTM